MARPDLRLCIAREAGGRLPPRWYGLAYLDSLRDVSVFYPIPLNYVVRAWRRLLWFWDRWRADAPRLDRRVRAATRRAYFAGGAALTPEERWEIAEMMVGRWRRWAAALRDGT